MQLDLIKRGQWFSPGTLLFSTNKTDRQDYRVHVGGRFGRRSRLVAAHFAFSRPKREVEVAL